MRTKIGSQLESRPSVTVVKDKVDTAGTLSAVKQLKDNLFIERIVAIIINGSKGGF
jgi:hypothetical protein